MSDPRAQPALEVRRFSFSLADKAILREVSFSVAAEEYLSIVGPNGAGKTTLLKCLDRIYTGGSGDIAVFGRPLASYRQKDLARRLSYVPQADGRVPPFTAEQFVLMGRYPYLSPFTSVRREDRLAAREAMEVTGTAEFAGRPLDTLSGGERQQVYVAAAVAQGADVLLLDEPTTFLDYRHQAEVRALLARLNAAGKTIVAVTHDVNRAALDSRRVVALREGRVVFCGEPGELMRADALRAIYGAELLLVAHPGTGLPVIVPAAAEDRP